MKIMFILTLLLSSLAWSVPERILEQEWKNKILPHFFELEEGVLVNKQGLSLHFYQMIKNSEAPSLVILPGRSEPSIKYAELIYDLRNSGLNIFILDHQGQGYSDRLLSDSQKGHVISFSHYVQDFKLFMDEVVLKNSEKEVYLIAHSMGGAIAAHYLNRHPDTFKKVALMAPMLQLNTEPYAEIVARYYSKLLVSIGQGHHYAPGRGPYKEDEDQFETNTVTQSRARFNVSKSLNLEDPELIVAGPTTRWVHEALKATKKIHKLQIKTPVILFQSGKDEIVRPKRQNAFCRKSFCTMRKYIEGKHELLMEKDHIRNSVLKEIESFFAIELFPENRKSIVSN